MVKKRVAVIGGGFSGIGSIKSLKEEGIEPVCFEKSSLPGGTWCYREEPIYGMPSIMPTTIINHSKEMGAVPNFVPRKEYPNYMRHSEMYQLFMELGEHFDCFKHVNFNREVISVKRSRDYDETGRWDLTIKNTETGEVTNDTFDGVMLAVGHITYPKMVEYPGMEKFKGTIMHSHSLKHVDKFKGQRVLVVGIGCSGIDAAVEISNVAKQVYLSTRDGTWLLPRMGPYGLPFDYALLRRYSAVIQYLFGYKFASWIVEKFQLNSKFNHNLYNLRPKYGVLCKDPITNDFLPAKLISGSIVLRKNVKCFTETGVIFENEDAETQVDSVIMATGYQWKFPFLEDGIIVSENGRINLYKCIYPPHLKHPTLAVIGFILPFGPGMPLGDMQCRVAARVFSGHLKLPNEEGMMEDVIRRHEENSRRYSPSEKMTVRVEYIQYMDELAILIGAKPNLWKYLFTDFKLFRALAFGPSLPYQYRLEGPHKWDGAREAILTAHERVRYPLSGKRVKRTTKRTFNAGIFLKYIITFLLMAFWLSQAERNMKYYILALILPYFVTWKGFYKKYFFSLLMLPFFVTWNNFISSYMVTLFVPILLGVITEY